MKETDPSNRHQTELSFRKLWKNGSLRRLGDAAAGTRYRTSCYRVGSTVFLRSRTASRRGRSPVFSARRGNVVAAPQPSATAPHRHVARPSNRFGKREHHGDHDDRQRVDAAVVAPARKRTPKPLDLAAVLSAVSCRRRSVLFSAGVAAGVADLMLRTSLRPSRPMSRLSPELMASGFVSRNLDLWAYQKDVVLDFSRRGSVLRAEALHRSPRHRSACRPPKNARSTEARLSAESQQLAQEPARDIGFFPPVAIVGENRCMPCRRIKRQAHEPTEQQIIIDLLDQLPFRTNREKRLLERWRILG